MPLNIVTLEVIWLKTCSFLAPCFDISTAPLSLASCLQLRVEGRKSRGRSSVWDGCISCFHWKTYHVHSLMFMKSAVWKRKLSKPSVFTLRISQVYADNSHWSSEKWFFDKASIWNLSCKHKQFEVFQQYVSNFIFSSSDIRVGAEIWQEWKEEVEQRWRIFRST